MEIAILALLYPFCSVFVLGVFGEKLRGEIRLQQGKMKKKGIKVGKSQIEKNL